MEGVAERERPVTLTSNGEPDRDGLHVGVTPHFAGWYYVGFEVLRLVEGRTVERRIEDAEVCLMVLSGRCTVSTDDEGWQGIGDARASSTARRTPSTCRQAWATR